MRPPPTSRRTPLVLSSRLMLTRSWLRAAIEEVFAKYAKERSDCGSFAQGGDLGMFGPGEMQKQFEDGTRSTAVSGTMSGIVDSDSVTI